MELTQAIKILKDHNEWRKGSDKFKKANPKELSEAIDLIIKTVEINLK